MRLIYIIGFFAVGQGLYQIFMLYNTRNAQNNDQYILLLILGFLSLSIFEYSLVWSGDIKYFPHLIGFTSLSQFLFLPMIYLFYRQAKILKNKIYFSFHFIPFLLALVCLSSLLLMTGEDKLNNITSIYLFKVPLLGWSIPLCFLFIVQAISYVILLYRMGTKNFAIYGNLILKFFIIYISIHIFHSFIIYYYPHLLAFAGVWILTFSIVGIYVISYLVYKRHAAVQEEKPAKYAYSNLSVRDAQGILGKLDELIMADNYFKDSDIRMNIVAQKIKVPQQQLSQAINQIKGVSFRSYLNGIRVDYAVSHIKSNIDKRISLKELSYDAGFNNKTSFANAFKHKMSMTPSKFLASQITN